MCLNSPPKTSEAPAITLSAERRGAVGVLDRMKRMLARGELSDLQFVVGRRFGTEKTFPAHKNIVCNSSDVFNAMICNGVAECCPLVIHFPDIPSEAFANLLSYVYTNSVEGINEENVFPTLHCADKFGFSLLGDICCEYIIKHVNADTCLTTLEKASRWSPDHAKIVEKCLEIVDTFSNEILRSKQFSSIGHDSLQMILQRASLSAKENIVYTAVNRWALQNCEERNLEPSAANRREVLGAALFLVRFPLLTDAQLAAGPIQSGLLLPTELRDIFLHKHAPEKLTLPFSTEPRGYRSNTTSGKTFTKLQKGTVTKAAAVTGTHGKLPVPASHHERMLALAKLANRLSSDADSSTANTAAAANINHPAEPYYGDTVYNPSPVRLKVVYGRDGMEDTTTHGLFK
ncbi:BTB/POZ domain-containing protein 1-like [Paramacrobiotus metropolitanus]|uniref:BTB/POZ domain-containing protein 1-like n=1 Tax=Paramacrobiotus metropolitanus TaxID=2943436 RepID=UPI0024459111|nr:BTB/POZ domain-containing protein 1-like [Paramacrobiotus metropolitanus]